MNILNQIAYSLNNLLERLPDGMSLINLLWFIMAGLILGAFVIALITGAGGQLSKFIASARKVLAVKDNHDSAKNELNSMPKNLKILFQKASDLDVPYGAVMTRDACVTFPYNKSSSPRMGAFVRLSTWILSVLFLLLTGAVYSYSMLAVFAQETLLAAALLIVFGTALSAIAGLVGRRKLNRASKAYDSLIEYLEGDFDKHLATIARASTPTVQLQNASYAPAVVITEQINSPQAVQQAEQPKFEQTESDELIPTDTEHQAIPEDAPAEAEDEPAESGLMLQDAAFVSEQYEQPQPVEEPYVPTHEEVTAGPHDADELAQPEPQLAPAPLLEDTVARRKADELQRLEDIARQKEAEAAARRAYADELAKKELLLSKERQLQDYAVTRDKIVADAKEHESPSPKFYSSAKAPTPKAVLSKPPAPVKKPAVAVKKPIFLSNQEDVKSPYAKSKAIKSAKPEDIIMRINQISEEGAPLATMKEVALLLQQERSKPENKTPEQQRKLNEALAALLKAMSSATKK